jgi:hypothetical protein
MCSTKFEQLLLVKCESKAGRLQQIEKEIAVEKAYVVELKIKDLHDILN